MDLSRIFRLWVACVAAILMLAGNAAAQDAAGILPDGTLPDGTLPPSVLPPVPPPGALPGSATGAPASLNPLIVTTAGGKKMVAVDGKPTPLFWAGGIARADQLEAYARTGFNTVVVRLAWKPTADGSLDVGDLQAPRAFATAAANKGLRVIYALPAGPQGADEFRMAADSNAYMTAWTVWTQGAITELRNTPNLIGWMLPDDPRSLPFQGDAGFARWLQSQYANVNTLNRQWNTNFNGLAEISLSDAVDAASAWRPPGPTDALPDGALVGFHPAALALAQYGWDAYRSLVSEWVRIVHEADEAHVIFSGRLRDYAQPLSLPPGVDVSIPDLPPGLAEADLLTHNPQAIDIARRGGRFAAMPVLSTAPSPAIPGTMLPILMAGWADAALAHGASGLVFASWNDLSRNEPLRSTIQSTLERLKTPAYAGLWQQAPIANAAVVLTPLADSYMRQTHVASGDNAPDGAPGGAPGSDLSGAPSAADDDLNDVPDLPGQARGLYGFGQNLVNGEPADLVFALRWGTAFGGVDYLAPDDIGGENDGLNRYSLLLLPQALSVPPAMARRLSDYAQNGGVVVADLGAGAVQSEGRVTMLEPDLAGLFGLAPGMQARVASFNLHSLSSDPLLPTWSAAANDRAGTFLTAGDGPNGAAFSGPAAVETLLPGTTALGVATSTSANGSGSVPPSTLLGSQGTALTLRPQGRGYAIFAPFRLWNFWRPSYAGFDGFHGDLWARGAAIVQAGVPSFVPAPRPNDDPAYPEVVNFSNAVAILNHILPRATSPQPAGQVANAAAAPSNVQRATVQTAGVGDFVWSDAIYAAPPGGTAGLDLAAGRPAPIAKPDDLERQPHPIVLYLSAKPGEMTVSRLLPIRVQNTAGGPIMARVTVWKSGDARLMVWPNATTVSMAGTEPGVLSAASGPAKVTLFDSDDTANYHVLPGSRHRVTFTNLMPLPNGAKRAPVQRILTADDDGKLTIEFSCAAGIIDVVPAL